MEANLTNTRKTGAQTMELDFSYRKISYELRRELIELVIKQGSSVYRAAKLLSINNSTAKAIIRKYRKDGSIYMRKKQMEKVRCPKPLRTQPEIPESPPQIPQDQLSEPSPAPLPAEPSFVYFYTLPFQTCYEFPNYTFTSFF